MDKTTQEATEIADPFVGQTISGYTFLQLLGRGGMGIVYKVHDTHLDRPVALKTLIPELAGDPVIVEHFIREARMLARLRDDNIVTVHNVADLPPYGKFIVMEFVDGESLAQRLQRGGAIPWREALSIARQLMAAIAVAHEEGVIHRDLKPANVMMTRSGAVKVADFGLAKVLADADQTKTQGVAGTLKYMAPEQREGLAFTDHRSDIFSAGMTIYEAIAGVTPYQVGGGRFTGEMPTLRQANAAVPADLSAIIMKSLQQDPARRYQSAREMLQDLDAVEARYKERRADRKKRVYVFAGVAALVLLALGVAFFASDGPQSSLMVTTIPPGATVFVGEKNIGDTPIESYPVDGSPLDLRIIRAGYVPFDTTLTVGKGQAVRLRDLALVESRGATLTVHSEPAGARVEIGGASVGLTPLEGYPLDASASAEGPLTLRLVQPGYAVFDTVLSVAPGEAARLSARLRREPSGPDTRPGRPEQPPSGGSATLVLTAHPSGRILIDGRPARSGANTVAPGRRTVTCGDGAKQTVTLREGGSAALECYFDATVNVSTAWTGGRVGIAPSATIRIDGGFEGDSPWSRTREAGSYRIEAGFPPNQPYEIVGGVYTVRTDAGKPIRSTDFDGSGFTVNIRPGFERERHLISFLVRDKTAGAAAY